ERRRLARESAASLRAELGKARVAKGFRRWVRVGTAIGTALVVWYGARRALAGAMTPGDVIVFTQYLRNLYSPIGGIAELIIELAGALVCGERLAEILETRSHVHDMPDAVGAPAFRGDVTFERVTFGYTSEEPVLRDVSFTVQAGQTVALVGSSGAGKTTLVNLLLRFYDPWDGRILVDGEDIRRFKLRSLRQRMGVVLQEAVLF